MKDFNSSGELIIQDATITDPGSPVNKSYVDGSRWQQLPLSTDSNIDELTDGAHPVPNFATAEALGLPEVAPGTINHYDINEDRSLRRQYFRADPTDGEHATYRRTYRQGSWRSWSRIDKPYRRGQVPVGLALEDLRGAEYEGLWHYSSFQARDYSVPADDAGFIYVSATSASTLHQVSTLGSPVRSFIRRFTGGQWGSEWDEAGASATPGPVDSLGIPATAEAAREKLLASRGGRIGTAGKGAVALRFDHNVRPFQDKVLYLLIERGLPGSMAIFVDAMDPQPGYSGSDETGKTWADVSSQFLSGIEVWSHSWSHMDAATNEEIFHEVVDSKTELERVIPEAEVVGWIHPGTTGTQYLGYGPLRGQPEKHASTYAGALIEATYGADNRNGATLTPLGGRHFGNLWLDNASSATATKNVIDMAAATATGVALALHPNTVDQGEGYISTETLIEILDHIVTLRDAGKLEVLTVGGLTAADPGSGWRQNIAPALSEWSGWGSGEVRTGTPASGILSTSFSLAQHAYTNGTVRECRVRAEGTGTVSITVKDRTGVSTLLESRDFDIDGETTLHFPFGVARTNNGLRVEIECTAGEVTVSESSISIETV